jgi:DNA helicase-2/ATP-dependent DNA helicase PcrA
MTTHSAKGLEFNVVFLSGLEEGLFPHENSLNEPKGLEEERRLMYVAVTRARQRLYLSFAQTRMLHGQTRYNLPSRFVEEIPAALIKWLTPKIARHGGVPPRLTSLKGAGRHEVAVPSNARDGMQPHTFAEEPRAGYAPRGDGSGWRIGQGVRHARFGEGIIVNLEGGGQDARAQINFGAAGMKWLALSVAKLEAA